MSQRLEDIKINTEWHWNKIHPEVQEYLSYLIEQTERVKEMEKDSTEWEIEAYTQKAGKKILIRQNKRYRKLLEDVLENAPLGLIADEIAKELYDNEHI